MYSTSYGYTQAIQLKSTNKIIIINKLKFIFQKKKNNKKNQVEFTFLIPIIEQNI